MISHRLIGWDVLSRNHDPTNPWVLVLIRPKEGVLILLNWSVELALAYHGSEYPAPPHFPVRRPQKQLPNSVDHAF